jgi:hypothetical protein
MNNLKNIIYDENFFVYVKYSRHLFQKIKLSAENLGEKCRLFICYFIFIIINYVLVK